jgi:hypothetical protein
MDLQPPSVLAQLPRPLHASTGKTHTSEVYSLADSKKRKRYEVAVAVDGEAVNLYNVSKAAHISKASLMCDFLDSKSEASNLLRRSPAVVLLMPSVLVAPQAFKRIRC